MKISVADECHIEYHVRKTWYSNCNRICCLSRFLP